MHSFLSIIRSTKIFLGTRNPSPCPTERILVVNYFLLSLHLGEKLAFTLDKETLAIIVSLLALIPSMVALWNSHKQLKQENDLNAKSEYNRQIENAIVYCDRFAQNVLPNYQVFKKKIHDGNIPIQSTFNENGFVEFTPVQLDKNYLEMLESENIYKDMNELDLFAIAVNKGYVDQDTCKEIVGFVFCEAVHTYIDPINYLKAHNEHSFKNTIELYQKWRKDFPIIETALN